jgi:hypothetical protein
MHWHSPARRVGIDTRNTRITRKTFSEKEVAEPTTTKPEKTTGLTLPRQVSIVAV